MGLDMYLTAKRYISDYDDSGKALRDHLEDLKVNGMTVKGRRVVANKQRILLWQ